MTVLMVIVRMAGLNVNFPNLLGSTIVAEPGMARWTVGFALHLLIGAVAGLVYAAGFEYGVQRSGALVGAGFGVAHGLMAGLFMSAIPAMNPLIPDTLSAPGVFLESIHFGPVVFILLHVAFGAVMGAVYGPTVQRAYDEHLHEGESLADR